MVEFVTVVLLAMALSAAAMRSAIVASALFIESKRPSRTAMRSLRGAMEALVLSRILKPKTMTRAAAAPEQLAATSNQWSGERPVPAGLKVLESRC